MRAMDRLTPALKEYAQQVSRLGNAFSTTEPSYYPAIRSLIAEVLLHQVLPFDARASTSEPRKGGGSDQPDFALYDGAGSYPVVLGEGKLPDVELAELAVSTEQKDQVGRYLAQTRAVLLCNVRAFGLLTVKPGYVGTGPVPPKQRSLEVMVDLWPSVAALKQGKPIRPEAGEELAELVERAVTRYASIAEPESLARILARFAKDAKTGLPKQFGDAVRSLLDDFGKALGISFHGSEGEEFLRSSLVQTAFYGLFAGWCIWRQSGKPKEFRWEDLSDYLRIPFLGSLFHEFRHPKRIQELRLAEHLERATEALRRVDEEAFFARFHLPSLLRNGSPKTADRAATAITYFYEPFLEAFDPNLRKELGVWYTPPEIVHYQVRRIDQLLRQELGCARGFADEDVVVLDPCCGTGAYLVEVLQCIADELAADGHVATLGAKLLQALSSRVIGFEILTAPFVIAQLQAYLLLAELGTEPDAKSRPAIFLTNALTGWEGPEQMKLHFPELQEEHDAAQKVKRGTRIIVVLGNPPYNGFAGVPMSEEADLVDHYKGLRRDTEGKPLGQTDLYTKWGIRKHWLNDLYIRFFRLAEKRIGEDAEYGIVSYISNSSYLTGRSHPIMRESLLENFHAVWIDRLNGDKYQTGKKIPRGLPDEGKADQSIFSTEHDPRGIQPGTCISTLLKRKNKVGSSAVGTLAVRNFWGMADRKRGALVASLALPGWSPSKVRAASEHAEGPREYEDLFPSRETHWRFVAQAASGGFEDWPGLDELFPSTFQGVNPNRGLEGSVVDVDRSVLADRMREYYSNMDYSDFSARHPVVCEPRARYEPRTVRAFLQKHSGFDDGRILPYLVFPFDARWIYYEDKAKLLNECRGDLWRNLTTNEFLVAVPQARKRSETRPLFSRTLLDLHLHDRGSVCFPADVLLSGDRGESLYDEPSAPKRVANLFLDPWRVLKRQWKLSGELDGADAIALVRELFRASLAILHAPTYEAEHGESLAQDWAHVPIPHSKTLFGSAVALGEQIAQLLDPSQEARGAVLAIVGPSAKALGVPCKKLAGSIAVRDLVVTYSYYGGGKGRWEGRPPDSGEHHAAEWGEETGDLWLNEHVYLRHVPRAVWEYELGGYPVVKKWLGYRDAKRRDGRALSLDELEELRRIVQRVAALLVLRSQLDKIYEETSADAFTAEELGLRTER